MREWVRVRGRPVVLYDGRCAFCRVCARVLRCLDRGDRLDLLDFNRPEAEALLAPLPAAERRTALHIADTEGSVHSAGPALRRALAEAIGPGAERVLTNAAVAPVVDAAYRVVAARRHHLGWTERFTRRHDAGN
ncbi:MAG: DCC1-like thiol-disulfide oxidoreductase family protein [Chloroflexi bacterium]|nr:DCC1-like thiol-disulfide oxidoreductase family protein [Chloroflexota bacterium]